MTRLTRRECLAAASLLAGTRTALAQAGAAGRREALVIGIGAYEGVLGLHNPPNDAQAVGRLLSGLGWRVASSVNETSDQTTAAVGALVARASGAEAALLVTKEPPDDQGDFRLNP